jgi:hypothetical protein
VRTTEVTNKREYFDALIRRVSNIQGNIVELGVGATKSARLLCAACIKRGTIRHYWGFDSFEGFPEPTSHDQVNLDHRVVRGYKREHWCDSPEDARALIVGYCDYPQSHLHLVKGFYSSPFFEIHYDAGPIAILHLDCDLYHSYWLGLSYFTQFVVRGGVIAFDEVGDLESEKRWPGAVRAVDEWLVSAESSTNERHEITWRTPSGKVIKKLLLIRT